MWAGLRAGQGLVAQGKEINRAWQLPANQFVFPALAIIEATHIVFLDGGIYGTV
jgi:hypothetical protein